MEASDNPVISGVPKHHDPSSQQSATPVKDASKGAFPFQFGSLRSPGLMNEMQPHGIAATSLRMPVPVGLPLGNAPQVQQPIFVQGLQPHPIQPQGITHQGQSSSFTTQMGPQLSNVGIGISLQYPQQHGGIYGGQRKTTDPNTHEELRLADGGSSGMRSHLNVPQSQQIHSFPPHVINYYPTSYGGSNIFFPPQGSMPLTTGQIAPNPHAARYNYTVNPGAQSLSHMDPSAINSLPVNKSSTMIYGVGDHPNFEHNREIRNPVSISSSAVQVTVKPAATSTIDKAAKPPSLNSPSIIELGGAQKHSSSSDEDVISQPPVVRKQDAGGESVASLPAVVEQSIPGVVESSVCDSLSFLALTTEESVPTAANVEGRRREPLVRSNSIKNHQKKMGHKGYSRPQNQAVVQPTPMPCLPSRALDHGKLLDGRSGRSTDLNVMLTFSCFLNKLTPQNFGKFFEQVKAVNIDNARTLAGVVAQIFDKALMKPTFCEMYANLCYHLAGELPDFVEDNEKITFKRLLLNKCQEEFERGEEEREEANRADAESEIKQFPEEREEKRLNARRRMLGNIMLIGELYKKRMLTERIMHECIKKLLGQYQNPDEEDLESLCKLMSTIGEMIDHPKAKDHMDAYFDRMAMLSNNMILSSRIRLMLKDSIDLRRNKWQQRRKVEEPKKMDDVHRDAAQEQHSQASRLARSPSMNQSGRRTPMDFGPRGSAMLSPSTQARAFGNRDARFDELQQYEPRTVSFPQRPLGDDSITLGAQGGLARGMYGRGPPANASDPILDPVESRRTMAAFDGLLNVSERSVHNSREDLLARYGTAERIVVPTAYDQVNTQERNMNFVNKDPGNDGSFDMPIATSPPSGVQAPASTQSLASENELLEEVLRDKSLAAIQEYYSDRDEKGVAAYQRV